MVEYNRIIQQKNIQIDRFQRFYFNYRRHGPHGGGREPGASSPVTPADRTYDDRQRIVPTTIGPEDRDVN